MVKFLDEAGLIRYTEKLKNLLAAKQDKLEGAGGQVVGFDSSGKAVPQGTESLRGPAGKDGTNGTDGKTAYQYAVDGGYTGTEAEFQVLMGTGPWLPLSGGELTGDLNLSNSQLMLKSGLRTIKVNASFVTTGDKNRFVLAIGSVSESSSITRNIVLYGVDTPTYDYDAANKKYVDDLVGDIASILDSINGEVA